MLHADICAPTLQCLCAITPPGRHAKSLKCLCSQPSAPVDCTCRGYSYDKKIVLSKLKCKDLEKVELRFIVQNKWWFNPHGKVRAINGNEGTTQACSDDCQRMQLGQQHLIRQPQRRAKSLISALLYHSQVAAELLKQAMSCANPCILSLLQRFGLYAQDLEISDSCYDKCTKGKPCHSCEFKGVSSACLSFGVHCQLAQGNLQSMPRSGKVAHLDQFGGTPAFTPTIDIRDPTS
jgi:hypothetical protein